MEYGSTSRDVEVTEEAYQLDQPSQPVPASASRRGLAIACVAVAAASVGTYVAVSSRSGGVSGVEVSPPTAFKAMKAHPLGALTCNEFDDDTLYPNDACNFGDSGVCESEVSTSHNYWSICGASCDEEEMAMREANTRPSGLYTNASWAVVCGWEAVTKLPDLCSNNFTSWIPTSSQNKAPRYDSWEDAPGSESDITNTTVDACNLHAFCGACEFTDSEGKSTYNEYCKAMTGYYGDESMYMLTNFFNHLDKFWCHDDVLESITKGTFSDKFHDPYASMLGRKESDSLRNQGSAVSPRNSEPAKL